MSNRTQYVKAQAEDQHSQPTTKYTGQPPAMHLPPLKLPPNLTFGPFPITASQAFHISPTNLTYALVNLRPLLPGHSLICPVRRVPRLSQLTDQETTDLFLTVKRVSAMLKRVFKADALNVAVQDGVEAGQSVPHVHVHILPRRGDDVVRGDEVYAKMDGDEGNLGEAWQEFEVMQGRRKQRQVRDIEGDDERRVNRTEGEMRKEAEWLWFEMGRQTELEGMRGCGADGEDGSGEIP